ncbi:polyprenyl diphosphate synthase [Balneatrix alpica]|uniref:polyprenyl diphosphate synthase n=1 Tax=Balneatrix alpica TaxID=75684 RepID=UPI002739123D|nr:polyprenyl diphosphate synthase [Balneatrix alpica]
MDSMLNVVPRHVAIIMDGNNRWAKKRLLPGVAGHKAGVKSVRAVIEVCARAKVEVLTLFAFSSENWKRPATEVRALMELFISALQREVEELHRYGIRLRVIGDRTPLQPKLVRLIEEAEAYTRDNQEMQLVVAVNYGGQWDIAQASRMLAEKVAQGHITPAEVTEQTLAQHLCLSDLPAPDLCIRTSGEQRISNFMLWQLAYAEFYFSPLLWPDFREEAMQEALQAFARRERRFGCTSEQLKEQ